MLRLVIWVSMMLLGSAETKLWTLKFGSKSIQTSLIKVAPYSFLSARGLISKISRWRKHSNSTPKSCARSRSKMPTNMASKLLKFVYRKRCLDRLRFQNICRLNSIVRNRFRKTAEFQDILPRPTLEKVENRWKIAKKWLSLRLFVAMATVCNILVWTKIEFHVCC